MAKRMIKVKLSMGQLNRAIELYSFGKLKGSIAKGKSNIYGAIGEIVVEDYFREIGMDVIRENTYDYDLIINGKKVDVKAKKTTVVPKLGYNCSVAAYNTTQKCDYYFFVRIMGFTIFLIGYMRKQAFYEQAVFKKKGDLDGEWKYKDDCYNIHVRHINEWTIGEEKIKIQE